MKKLQCELCHATEILKEGEFFVCQYCGCKYTEDQAKKMLIEGTVNISGKVQIDTSEKAKNLYIIARRSRDNKDWDAAKKYYDLVLQEDPLSWEATFYLAYFDAYYCTNAQLQIKSEKICNCINSVCTLINESNMSNEEIYDAYLMLHKDVVFIGESLQEKARNFRNTTLGIKFLSPTMLLTAGSDYITYFDTVIPMINCTYYFGDGIEKILNKLHNFPKLTEIMIECWDKGNKDLAKLYGPLLSDKQKETIKKYDDKIEQYCSGPHKRTLELEIVKEEKPVETPVEDNDQKTKKGGATKGLVFGILSFTLSFTGIISIIFAIIGLVFSIRNLKSKEKTPAIFGLISSILGIISSIICLFYIILFIFPFIFALFYL